MDQEAWGPEATASPRPCPRRATTHYPQQRWSRQRATPAGALAQHCDAAGAVTAPSGGTGVSVEVRPASAPSPTLFPLGV